MTKDSKKDKAVVVPPSGGQMVHRQSRFDHLPTNPWRILCSGRSGSGKTSAMWSAITDHYKGVFTRLIIVCRTAKLDHSYVQLREWAEKHLGQDDTEKKFVFTWMDEDALYSIFKEQEQIVAKEKVQRKIDKSKEPLSSTVWVIDDLSDSMSLRQRNESVLNKLFTTGRHSSQSVFLNIHSMVSAGPLLRKNASALILFKISNSKDYKTVSEEFGHLVGGTDVFDEVYQAALGPKSPPYSFLVIKPHEQDVNEMFLARWDQKITVESDSEEDDVEEEVAPPPQRKPPVDSKLKSFK